MNIKRIFLIILPISLFLSACGDPPTTSGVIVPAPTSISETTTGGSPTSDSRPTKTFKPSGTSPATPVKPTDTIRPTPIVLPTLGPFPTLGPPPLRTPQAAGVCPPESETQPKITAPANGETMAEAFGPLILDYLNTKGSHAGLVEALFAQTLELYGETWQAGVELYLADITGDAVDEVIINLVFSPEESGSWQFTDGRLWVFTCREESYISIHEESTGAVISAPEDGVRAVQDINRDGRAEIVLSSIDNCGMHANCTRVFRVLGWDGRKMLDLAFGLGFYSGEPRPGIYVYNGDGVIRDTNTDGYYELVMFHGPAHYDPAIGPERTRTDIFRWNGKMFTLASWEHTAPVYRIHAVWDGDDAMLFGEYNKALAFYQQVVFDDKLLGWSPPIDPDERLRLSAYARFRIMLLHQIQGYDEEAQIVFDTLQLRFPPGTVGSQYVTLAMIFWDEYAATDSLESGCRLVIDYAASHDEEVLIPLYSAYHMNIYEPEDVCPYIH